MSDHAVSARVEEAAAPRVEAGHPTVGLYVRVIVFLAIVTAIEIAIILPGVKAWYTAVLPWFVALVPPILLLLSIVKFLGVVLFFMHLKQDRGVPRMVFFGPLAVAVAIILVLMLLYGTLL